MNSLDAHNWCLKLFLRRSDGAGSYYDFNTKLRLRAPKGELRVGTLLPEVRRNVARFVQRHGHAMQMLPPAMVPCAPPVLVHEDLGALLCGGTRRFADLDLYGELEDATGRAVASFAFRRPVGPSFGGNLAKVFLAPSLAGESAVEALAAAFPNVPRAFVNSVALNGGNSRTYLAARDILSSVTASGCAALSRLMAGGDGLDLNDREAFPALRHAAADDWEVLSVGSVRSVNSGLTTGTSLDGDWDLIDVAPAASQETEAAEEPVVHVRSTASYASALLREADGAPAMRGTSRREAVAARRALRREAARRSAEAQETQLDELMAQPTWSALDKFTAAYGFRGLNDGGPLRRDNNPGVARRRNRQNVTYAKKDAFRRSKPA